jgi:putative spermidine/putrescine transport system permease protein
MRTAFAAVLVAALGLGLGLPVAFVLAASLHVDGQPGLTLENYVDILSSDYFMGALGATLLFCSATAAAGTLLALPCAWWIARGRTGARLLRVLCQMNFAFSGVVYGMLMVTLLGNAGVLALAEAWLLGTDATRGYVYTTGGLAIGYLGFQSPRAAILIAQAVERLDPDVLAAARVLGAAPRQLAFLVLLPQLARPMAATFLAIATMSMASFGTALLIARSIEIFPVLIFREFIGFGEINRAAAMGVLLAACCIGLEMAARRFGPGADAAVGRTERNR